MRKLEKFPFLPVVLSLLFCFSGMTTAAQVVNFDLVIPPEGQLPSTFEDYLVQLAWTNSQEREKFQLEREIEQKEVTIERRNWMDDIAFTFNLNEVSLENILAEDKSEVVVINPLYSFSATTRLSTFFSNKKKREIAEIEVKLKDLEANQRKLEIRQLVLSSYQNFLLTREIKEVRIKGEEGALTNYDYASEQFKRGDLNLEDLIRSQESHQRAIEQRLDAETKVLLAKYELEQLIGIKWEVAEKYQERLK